MEKEDLETAIENIKFIKIYFININFLKFIMINPPQKESYIDIRLMKLIKSILSISLNIH